MSESATASAPAKTQPKAKKNRLSSGFFRFVLTRFLLIIPTVFILVTIVFFVMRATGDPISAAMGGRLTPEELEAKWENSFSHKLGVWSLEHTPKGWPK